VKIDQTDPNTFDMTLAYQDNLPPETKQLKEFVESFKDKEENKESLIEEMKQNAKKKLEYCQVKLCPLRTRSSQTSPRCGFNSSNRRKRRPRRRRRASDQ